MTVYTDHTVVKAILETPNPTGKIARWWTKVYGSGVKSVSIQYRSGRQNSRADALSRSPQPISLAMGVGQSELQVAAVSTNDAGEAPDIWSFLNAEPICVPSADFASEQRKDPDLREIVDFLEKEELPCEEKRAKLLCRHLCSPLKDSSFCTLTQNRNIGEEWQSQGIYGSRFSRRTIPAE